MVQKFCLALSIVQLAALISPNRNAGRVLCTELHCTADTERQTQQHQAPSSEAIM